MRVVAKRHFVTVGLAALFLLGLLLTTWHHFLLFHTLAELISIAIAGGIFVLAWNTRRFTDNGFLVVLGTAYLAVGGIDLLHTLAYEGMAVFAGYDADLATQLWIAARYLQSVSIVLACHALEYRVRSGVVAVGYAAVTGVLLWLVFSDHFPHCYIEGQGLTPFKILSEYVICLVFAAGIACLLAKKRRLDASVRRYIIAAILATIASEIAFTRYVSLYGPAILVGHLLKIFAFYLMYKGIIEGGVRRPFSVLFRNLARSEEELRRQRDFVSNILNTARALIVVIDGEGRLVEFNPACAELTGYSVEEAAGRYYWDVFVAPEEREDRQRLVTEVRAGRELDEFESVWLTRSGERRTIVWTVAVSRDERGEAREAIACGIDITERKRAERELRQALQDLRASEEALRQERDFVSGILATAGALMIVVDREGRIVRFNRACEQLTGYKAEDVEGRFYGEITGIPEAVEDRRRLLEQLAAGRQLEDYETEWVTRDGSRRTIAWWTAALRDKNGELEFLVGSGVDVTQRNRALDDLHQVVAEKELLLDELHHRVKNNLQIVAGLLDMARRQAASEEARRAIGDAHTKIHAMALIHDQTYRATRLDQIDLGSYLRRLTRYLAEAYGPEDGHLRVAVDAKEVHLPLTQAVPCGLLINELVVNAFQHAFPGHDRGEIFVRATTGDDGEVTVIVRDDGIGMVPPAGDDHGRTLGLRLVQGLVSQLKGSVEFAADAGTEVTVRFPRERRSPPAAEPE